MKKIHFNMPNNLSLLHDELPAAMSDRRPQLRPTGALDPFRNPALQPVMRLHGDAENVWLAVPDMADTGAINSEIQARDPAKNRADPRGDCLVPIAEVDAIGRSDWTSAQMRELIYLLALEVNR